jgi:thiol:disulfide interchange protein
MNCRLQFAHWALTWLVALWPNAVFAQPERASGTKKDPVFDQLCVSAEVAPAKARRGDIVTLKITLDPTPGFHTYPTKQSDPNASAYQTRVKFLELPDLAAVGEFQEPTPECKEEPDLKAKVDIYQRKAVLERRFVISRQARPGLKTIKIQVGTLVCDDTGCLPFDKELTVALNVTAETATDSASGSSSSDAGSATARTRLVGFLLQGIFWGAVSLLTPCVFPMIPITVSFFLKRSERQHDRPLLLALVYCATIVSVLTLSADLLLKFFQDLSQHWATNLILGGLFVVFALSLFGTFELRLPARLINLSSAQEGRGGLIGTIFMALTFTLISFTCVAPFLGGFAGVAVEARPFYEVVLGGLAFSATFAAPFFLLAMFPSILRRLPKSGSWMNSVKVVMGFLELAAGLKFLRAGELVAQGGATILTYDLVLGMYIAISLLCGFYLLGLFRLPHDHESAETVGGVRLLVSFLFLSVGLYLVPALITGNNREAHRPGGEVFAWLDSFLLPEPAAPRGNGASGGDPQQAAASPSQAWTPDLQTGLARAWKNKLENRPGQLVFIDFTGMSCTNCKKNENNVFAQPLIRELMGRYTLVQLFTDTVPAFYESAPSAAQNKTFQLETFGDLRLPLYVILEPLANGKFRELSRYDEGLIRDAAAFADFLKNPLRNVHSVAAPLVEGNR